MTSQYMVGPPGGRNKKEDIFRSGRLLPLSEAKKHPKILMSKVSAYVSARDGRPETYPGKRPPASYLYLKQRGKEPMAHVMAFADQNDPLSAYVFVNNKFVKVDDILKDMGLPPMKEQYMMIGYGSNPCPGQIRKKIEDGRKMGVEGIKDAVVVLRGKVKGADPVIESFFHGGYPYAGIMEDERTANTAFEGWGTLFDSAMLKVVHDSEVITGEDVYYKVADGYPFQIDGITSGERPILVSAAAYTGASDIYNPTLASGYTGPVAFDTIPADNRVFPEANVQGVFEIMLENMAKEDRKYEIGRLLAERGVKTEGSTSDKSLALMRWINAQWQIIEDGERPHQDLKLVEAIREHVANHSDTFNMLAKRMKEGRVFSDEEAYAPEKLKLGNLLEWGQD